MQNPSRDLWPDDISGASNLLTPVSILKEQASLLGRKTGNLVEAEVDTSLVDYERLLQHSFILVAPALKHYRYLLFRVTHSATQLYPLEIDVPVLNTGMSAGSEIDFIEKLKDIFAGNKTKEIIQTLIAQSRS